MCRAPRALRIVRTASGSSEAHEWGKYVGRADFEFRNGEMKLVHYQLIPVNLKKKVTYDNGQSERVLYTPQIAENPQMMSLLTPFQNKGKGAAAGQNRQREWSSGGRPQ